MIYFIILFVLYQVNGRNLLSVDFDRTTKTEKIYDDHRKFLLRIAYDTSGHPTLWLPSSKLMAVNVTYSSTGQIASIQRGTTSEKVDYDGQGRIVSRVFADGKTWSYTYLEKVRCSQRACKLPRRTVGWAGRGRGHQDLTQFHLLFRASICKSGP